MFNIYISNVLAKMDFNLKGGERQKKNPQNPQVPIAVKPVQR